MNMVIAGLFALVFIYVVVLVRADHTERKADRSYSKRKRALAAASGHVVRKSRLSPLSVSDRIDIQRSRF